jgi:hypothetical protein
MTTPPITYAWSDESGSWLIYQDNRLIDSCGCMDEVKQKYPSAVDDKQTPKNFIPEQSSADFKLTPEEEQHLENLSIWQQQSAKSVIKLGGHDQ